MCVLILIFYFRLQIVESKFSSGKTGLMPLKDLSFQKWSRLVDGYILKKKHEKP